MPTKGVGGVPTWSETMLDRRTRLLAQLLGAEGP